MTPNTLAILIALCVQLTVSLFLLALPYITHRDLLFGVLVGRTFRSSEPGRRALRRYRLWILVPSSASLLSTLLFRNAAINAAGLMLTSLLGMTAFVLQNRKLKSFVIPPSRGHQAALAPPARLPWFAWLGVLPLAFLAVAAAYLHSDWDRIPLRYPVHFDISGAADGWAQRSVRGVYGPLILGGEFAIVMFAMVVAGWYGSRQSDRMRKPMVIVMVTVETALALTFGSVALRLPGVLGIPVPWLVFGPLVLVIPAVVYAVHQSNKPSDPVDPTPNECWKGGMIYYNPNDAALFVQRRDGVGFTVNLANRWSWVLYGALALVVASIPVVLG